MNVQAPTSNEDAWGFYCGKTIAAFKCMDGSAQDAIDRHQIIRDKIVGREIDDAGKNDKLGRDGFAERAAARDARRASSRRRVVAWTDRCGQDGAVALLPATRGTTVGLAAGR